MSVITALLVIFFGSINSMVQRSHIYKNEAYNYLSKFCSYFDHRFNKEKKLITELNGISPSLRGNWLDASYKENNSIFIF